VLPRQFASQKALLDYAEQNGLVYMWAYTQRERVLSPAFIAREHLLSPDQYELVDVRTRSGVRRALLFPKAILQAEFEANREALFLRKIEIKVHPKRPRRQSTRLTNLSSHRVGVCAPKYQHAKSACIAHGGCEGRTDCTPHRCLNNRQFDPQSRT